MKPTTFIKLFLWYVVLEQIAFVVTPTLTTQATDWMMPTFASAEYILIGIFMLIAWDTLAEYNIDSLSLVLFIVLGTIFRLDASPSGDLGSCLRVVAWVAAGILLFRAPRKGTPFSFPRTSTFAWAIVGLVSGVLLAMPMSYLTVHSPGFRNLAGDPSLYTSVRYVAQEFAIQGSNVAIQEEYIFRGLLLGYLGKLLGNQKRALLL
ncbi:MAG TPA: hypothetical protein VLZ89_06340, partial [Anaerolineales bacterium]|nr:hypothetical protein [Anaerolineales bacterium]